MAEELLFSKLDTHTSERSITDLPTEPVLHASNHTPTAPVADADVTFKDMDQDGDLDIVVSPHNGKADYWLANDIGPSANQVFSQTIFSHITPTAIAAGDVDNDGTTDLVIGHLSGAKVFHNNGHWDMKDVTTVLSHPHTIYLEDVNQDGQTDMVVRDSRELTLIQGVFGTFGSSVMTWANLGDSALLAIGNFDLTNTSLEILTLDANTGYIGMVTSESDSWQAIQTVSTVEVSSFIIADLNFDGYDDIYVEDEDGNIVWLEGDGTGDLIYHDDDSFMVADYDTDDIYDEYSDSGDDTVISEGGDEDLTDDGTAYDDLQLAEDIDYLETTLTEIETAVETSGWKSVLSEYAEIARPINPETGETLDFSDYTHGVDIDLDNLPPPPEGMPFGPDPEMIRHILGSEFSDEIRGDEFANKLFGGDGTDKLFGGLGDDTLLGGDGLDLLFGDYGDDFIAGQRGDDLLFGDFGNDTMFGGDGKDILFGHVGHDILHGGIGDDILSGGDGDDFLFGGMGKDTMGGDPGRDIYHYRSMHEGGDLIKGFENGMDMITFEFGSRTLHKITGPYDGDLDIEGDGFVVERTGDNTCKLYYDEDTSTTGNEWLIAEIEGLPSPEDAESFLNFDIDSIEVV